VTWLLLSLALGLAPEPPVFPARVELVYVDVFVTKKDAPVSGLRASDFRVRDNGVEQRVEVVARDLAPTTAVLALDTSASVAGAQLVRLKEAARAFLTGLGERDEAALVTFNHKLVLRADATRDVAVVEAALDRVRARGGTSLIDTLYVCLKRRWGTGRPLVVLFTDGEDTGSWLENEDVVEAARESSVLLYVVGTEPAPGPVSHQIPFGPLGVESHRTESGYVHLLRRAAETTGGRYWPVESLTRLPAAFRAILEASNARYVLRYEPTGVRRPGRHRLKVSVRRHGVEVRARQEYVIPAAPPE
jgi:VWFA-related protein